MTYSIHKLVESGFDQAGTQTIEALAGEGFGVLTDNADLKTAAAAVRDKLTKVSHAL